MGRNKDSNKVIWGTQRVGTAAGCHHTESWRGKGGDVINGVQGQLAVPIRGLLVGAEFEGK